MSLNQVIKIFLGLINKKILFDNILLTSNIPQYLLNYEMKKENLRLHHRTHV
jgi:hypothetical protein